MVGSIWVEDWVVVVCKSNIFLGLKILYLEHVWVWPWVEFEELRNMGRKGKFT